MARLGKRFAPAVFGLVSGGSTSAERQGKTKPASLEEQVARLSRRQRVISLAAAGVAILALALTVYVAAKIERLSANVGELPAKIDFDVRQAIKAATQENGAVKAPQVVVLPTIQQGSPAPAQQQAPASPPPVVLGPHSSGNR
jgi:cell division protein FtsL